jgi:hypothetical protein
MPDALHFQETSQKRNLRLDSVGPRADRWQEMSLRSFCRASFPACLRISWIYYPIFWMVLL